MPAAWLALGTPMLDSFTDVQASAPPRHGNALPMARSRLGRDERGRTSLARDPPKASGELVPGQHDPSPACAAYQAHVRPEPDHLPFESTAGVGLLESDGVPEPQVGGHPPSALPERAAGGVGTERLAVTSPGPLCPGHHLPTCEACRRLPGRLRQSLPWTPRRTARRATRG